MPGTPSSAQPVRVEYVPKSQRKSGGASAPPAPKPAPPRVEPMPDALASEFGDFDDGPARMKEMAVEAEVVSGAETEAEAKVPAGSSAGSRKKKGGKGSRKRRK